MTERHNIPGPGEHQDPEMFQAEAHSGPIPDGEMLGVDPVRERRHAQPDMAAVEPLDTARCADREHSGLRREGLEYGVNIGSRSRQELSEQRLDRSAAEQTREQALDSVHDDTGPRSDQC